MERIKLAIEKARKTNPGQKPRRASVVQSLVIEDEGLEDLNYSSTEVVNLDLAHLAKNRILAFNKNDPSSWMFDILRTKVLQKMEENGWKTLAITSPTPECGKTVVATNLAMSIAHQSNKTTMLVDFDLRRPKIKSYLGLAREKSLNDVLASKAEISEAMVNPGIPRMVVLPTNTPVKNSSEVLSSKMVTNIIRDLRDRYDERIVIFDLPPMLNADDAMAVLPQIDCVLLIVGNGQCTKREIEDSLRHLPDTNLLGVVLNKGDIPTKQYYY